MTASKDALPFPLSEKTSGTYDDLPLGAEFTIEHATRGTITVRLVQLNLAAGVATPLDRIFVATTPTDPTDFQVETCDAQLERAAGIGLCEEALVDNDFFFVQVDGLMSIHMGDDGTDSVVGELIGADDDADRGACYNTARLLAAALFSDIGYAIEVVTDVDTSVLVVPLRKLQG